MILGTSEVLNHIILHNKIQNLDKKYIYNNVLSNKYSNVYSNLENSSKSYNFYNLLAKSVLHYILIIIINLIYYVVSRSGSCNF